MNCSNTKYFFSSANFLEKIALSSAASKQEDARGPRFIAVMHRTAFPAPAASRRRRSVGAKKL